MVVCRRLRFRSEKHMPDGDGDGDSGEVYKTTDRMMVTDLIACGFNPAKIVRDKQGQLEFHFKPAEVAEKRDMILAGRLDEITVTLADVHRASDTWVLNLRHFTGSRMKGR